MDVTEIIECLNRRKKATGIALNYFSSDRAEKEYRALTEGIEILERHIPAVIETNKLDSPLCPYCRRMFYSKYNKYCPNCGQLLDWKRYEEAIRRDAM